MKTTITALSLLAWPMALDAQDAPFPVTAISQVSEANTRVAALAVDFGSPLPLNWMLASAFEVNAELRPVTSYEGKVIGASAAPKAPRTILRAYTSDMPEMGSPRAGRYVIIEMDTDDFNASSWYMGYNPGFRQILPYAEQMSYEVDLLHDLTYLAADAQPDDPALAVETISEKADFAITGERIRTADQFKQAVFRQPENTAIQEISYNFFDPKTDEPAPLVVFLHGSGQSHDTTNFPDDIAADTRSPLITNQGAVTWIENGSEPAFVLAPQAPARDLRDDTTEGGWRSKDAYSLLVGLIDKIVDENPRIDPDRIYLAGLSMGAMGSWKLLTDPDPEISQRFAAAVVMSGVPVNTYTSTSQEPAARREALAAKMREMSYDALAVPVWLTHADTDPVVNVDGSRIPFAMLTGSATDGDGVVPADDVELVTDELIRSYWGINQRSGDEIRYTEYLFGDGDRMLDLGMATPNAHFSWEVTFKDQAVIDWLFSQRKQQAK